MYHRQMARWVPIAAVAERAGLTLLHDDADFEQIAMVTGRPVRWVVPRGSVD
jgi:predicted nuclease of predicted toxin-antitoxin system